MIQGILCRLLRHVAWSEFPKQRDARVCEAFVSVSVSICETRGEEGPLRKDYWNRGSVARLMHMGNPHYPALLARASRRYRGFGERQMG